MGPTFARATFFAGGHAGLPDAAAGGRPDLIDPDWRAGRHLRRIDGVGQREAVGGTGSGRRGWRDVAVAGRIAGPATFGVPGVESRLGLIGADDPDALSRWRLGELLVEIVMLVHLPSFRPPGSVADRSRRDASGDSHPPGV
jgi:hypothetical protein